ncbi:hypothetical protein LCGC14_2495780 [marine sediment metagenome]|uniref:Uncharacterized protein n=1 Tax=marine sediment metagenome TaxID=412755 RepID=A0A0F9B449_9ZZZZ
MKNIVAHVYNDNMSYGRFILNWRRIFGFPLVILASLFDRSEFHFCMHEIITYFSGHIVQKESNRFVIKSFPEDKYTRKIWRNLYRGGPVGVLPSYKKTPEYTCWATREGDSVAYLPLSSIDLKEHILTLKEFLKLTKQSVEEFSHGEYIKYTGM